MTAQQLADQIGIKLKKVGVSNGYTYYTDANILDNEEVGIPVFIKVHKNVAEVCTADESLKMIGVFYAS